MKHSFLVFAFEIDLVFIFQNSVVIFFLQIDLHFGRIELS